MGNVEARRAEPGTCRWERRLLAVLCAALCWVLVLAAVPVPPASASDPTIATSSDSVVRDEPPSPGAPDGAPPEPTTTPLSRFHARGPQGSVYRLYRAFLAREPDRGGFDHWVAAHSAGYPLAAIAGDFAASAEFTRTYGLLDDHEFVVLVYANVLGRHPEPGGMAFWLDQVRAGATRGQVMVAFSDSIEFRDRTVAGTPPGYHVDVVYEADVTAIETLWDGQEDAFRHGTHAGFEYMAEHNYPGMGASAEQCRALAWNGTDRPAPDGYMERSVLVPGSVEEDPGWVVPDGPIAGQPVTGRVYVMTVLLVVSEPGFDAYAQHVRVHATVTAGAARFFTACYR